MPAIEDSIRPDGRSISNVFPEKSDKNPVRRLTLLLGAVLSLAFSVEAQDSQPTVTASRSLDSLSLEELMQIKVQTAALHPQALQDAPASVTIITAEDIRKYGYRTLGEALSGVRGFYVSNDRTYTSVGVRGFDLPGDYDSHVLVMVNGHNMTDHIFQFNLFFGNDFPVDMNLIKQIEIIRGPSSALYGSNAVFATINIITKSPDEAGPLALTVDVGSFGEKKVQIEESASLGGVKILFSGSLYNNTGQSSLYFPQFDTPQNNSGVAIDMNGEKGYHLFANAAWRDWTVVASFADHDIIQPISWGNTIFNDRGTNVNDQRDFIDVAYEHQVGGGTLRWRTYYDSYYCNGRYDYALSDGSGIEDNHQSLLGDWVGTQLTYRFRPSPAGDFTVVAEGTIDLRMRMTDADITPVPFQFANSDNRDRTIAFVVQDEKKLSTRWTLDLGLRFDRSGFGQNSVSPRAALLYQRSDWTYKLLYGRGFRDPSVFQLFYSDGLSAANNPSLYPETADTVEIDVERKLGKRMNLQASAYGYQLRDFLEGVILQDGLLQYQNLGTVEAEGLDLEINGRPWGWLDATASYAVQHARGDGGDNILANSPMHLAKLRFAVPLGQKFDLSSSMQYESSRETLANNALPPVYIADFTLTSKHLLGDFDVRLGVRNALNTGYSDPVALFPTVDSMPRPGRSFFLELIPHRTRQGY
jgi:outer membrane receptor for ferrienterochelin and colicins